MDLSVLSAITTRISRLCIAISACGLVISAVCLFLQVVLRAINITAMWSTEFARYGFMISVFYGLAAVTDKGAHLTITLVQDKMNPVFRKYFLAAMKLVFAVLFAALAYGMFLAAEVAADNQQSMEAFANINISWLYYVVFGGFGISAVNALLSSIVSVHSALKEEKAC